MHIWQVPFPPKKVNKFNKNKYKNTKHSLYASTNLRPLCEIGFFFWSRELNSVSNCKIHKFLFTKETLGIRDNLPSFILNCVFLSDFDRKLLLQQILGKCGYIQCPILPALSILSMLTTMGYYWHSCSAGRVMTWMEVTQMTCSAQIHSEAKSGNKAFYMHGLWILLLNMMICCLTYVHILFGGRGILPV